MHADMAHSLCNTSLKPTKGVISTSSTPGHLRQNRRFFRTKCNQCHKIGALVDKAEKAKAADPKFLKDLRAAIGSNTPY
jgi:mono/diheme cytochrome c family protein